jgi:anti-anti-sigma factor
MKIDMEIGITRTDQTTTVAPCGRLDATSAAEFEQRCIEAVEAGATGMTLDFRSLDYISSAGLRAVLTVGKRLQAKGGQLALANLDGMVKQVFEFSGFLSLFSVRTDAPK